MILGQAVIAKHGEFGVNIRGIIESENTTGSEFADLVSAGKLMLDRIWGLLINFIINMLLQMLMLRF